MSQMRTLRDYAPSFSSEKNGPEEKCGGGGRFQIPSPFPPPMATPLFPDMSLDELQISFSLFYAPNNRASLITVLHN